MRGLWGEESCARDPSLLDGLDHGSAWIVDPIDGTGNYAAGRAPFAIMAAYLTDGELMASAILNPLSGRLMTAERGAGALCDGVRMKPKCLGKAASSFRALSASFCAPPRLRRR